MSEAAIRQAFRDQARICAAAGSPLTAAVIDSLEAAIDHETETGRRVLSWAGDARGTADSVPLRLAGGMHALARQRVDARLSQLYGGTLAGADVIVASVLHRFDTELVRWLDVPPQTNEVGRASPMMAGLLLLAAEHRLPFELIELGASAGLNLNLDRFGYRLGTTRAGDSSSQVQLAPEWEGASPPAAPVKVIDRRGVDQTPIRIGDPSSRERLIAYCWADRPERMARLEAAIALAETCRPPLEQGDAADFAEAQLATLQPDGVLRVLYHTIFWSYLPPDKQDRVRTALARAGVSATPSRPLAWLRYELNGDAGASELHLQCWPGGENRHLATGHPHGSHLLWLAGGTG